jgi:methylated-DNA-[protein]-cysteine S-methyltransferase
LSANIIYHLYRSPLGIIEIRAIDDHITGINFRDEEKKADDQVAAEVIKTCIDQLDSYFAGDRKTFDLPLTMEGTLFQNKVWKALQEIPFGQTWSYKKLAVHLGDPKCIRAAARSNALNPFAIVVPCHRVIGTDGTLTGYAGGVWRKQWLLDHEYTQAPSGQGRLVF